MSSSKDGAIDVCRGTAPSGREVCSTLGMTCSRLHKKPRGGRPKAEDSAREAEVVLALKGLAGQFPTYGCRRLKALVSRQMRHPVDAKRTRRLRHAHGPVAARRVQSVRPRPHPREVEATCLDQAWQMDFVRVMVGSRWY